MIVTSEGIPVKLTFTAGSTHDFDGIRQMPVNMPKGNQILTDAVYTDYFSADMLANNNIIL